MLVVLCKLDPYYVRRQMDGNDVASAFRAYERLNREGWEQTRVLAYNISAPYMKHAQSVTNFMPLPWDEKKAKVKPPTREDFERLKKKFNLK